MAKMNLSNETLKILMKALIDQLPKMYEQSGYDLMEAIWEHLEQADRDYDSLNKSLEQADRDYDSLNKSFRAAQEVARAAEECNETRAEMITLMEGQVRHLHEVNSKNCESINHLNGQVTKHQQRVKSLQDQIHKMEKEWLKANPDKGMVTTPFGPIRMTEERVLEIIDYIRAGETVWAVQILRSYCGFGIWGAEETLKT